MNSFQADASPHSSTKNDEGPTRYFDKEFAGHVVAFFQKVGGKVSASFEPYSTVIMALNNMLSQLETPTEIEILKFEPSTDEAGTKLATNVLRQPRRNRTPFELGLRGKKPVIRSKKPTITNDDGLVRKESRGDRTSIELFCRGVGTLQTLDARIRKDITAIMG